MQTTTPREVQRRIMSALGDRAKLLRRDSRSRKFTGPAYSSMRAALRAEAEQCENLQRIIAQVSPEALAAVMTAEAIRAQKNPGTYDPVAGHRYNTPDDEPDYAVPAMLRWDVPDKIRSDAQRTEGSTARAYDPLHGKRLNVPGEPDEG